MKIKRLTAEDRARAWAWYFNDRLSSEEIARKLGVSGPAIRGTIRRMGGAIRDPSSAHRTLPLNEGAFGVLTRDAAYWAGMLMTDGCVYDAENPQSSPRVELTLQSTDAEHLRAFDRFMGGDGDSRIRDVSKDGGTYHRWDARSVRLAEDLAKLGIVPRKTETADPPAALRRDVDFWRGCWDGDGEVDEGNGCPELSLVGSFPLVAAFCDFFAQLCPEYPLKPRPDSNTSCTSTVRLYGQGAMELLRAIYDRPGPAMPRKADAARSLLAKYAGRTFRILKADITQRTTFPWVYTDLRKAQADFAALKALGAATIVKPLTKTSGRVVQAFSIEASRVGMYASHFFHEQVRMRARVRGKPSPVEVWADLGERERIIEEAENRKHSSLRASLTANTRPCWGFHPAVAKAVYQHFAPQGRPMRILDPCAGWGDRLTAALALPQLGCYVGVDPNRAMQPVYERIRNCFDGHATASVIPKAFEDCAGLNDFDIAFTSPPYFNYEEYSEDPEQSFRRYPTPEGWVEGFLRPMTTGAAGALRPGGILAVNIADAGTDSLVDATAEAAEKTGKLRFVGILLMQTGNFDRACEGIYCWRRV